MVSTFETRQSWKGLAPAQEVIEVLPKGAPTAERNAWSHRRWRVVPTEQSSRSWKRDRQ